MIHGIELDLVKQVLSLPTMSFHEAGVATFVKWYSLALGFKVREDRFGNVLVYRGSKPQGVVFTAHMDHPGFEVVSSKGRDAVVALWGKVDPKLFAGSRVMLYTDDGEFHARVGAQIKGKRHLGKPLFKLKSPGNTAKEDFGHFDLTPVRVSKDRIVTRAADNLMGVAAILDMFTQFVTTKTRAKVVGLFTRGEEAGFLGAFGAMETDLISKSVPLVVLECSSAQHAKVEIGEGPVIRVGDWQSSYDPTIDRWISDVAGSLAVRPRSRFHFQRELLPGGRCEACAYIAEGYRTGGIALPLGNYHNHGPKGPAAEYVSVSDYENMVTLMMALAKAKLPDKNYLRKRVAPLRKNYMSLKKKLLNSR